MLGQLRIEHPVIKHRVERHVETVHRAAGHEYLVAAAHDLVGRKRLGDGGRHRRTDAGAPDEIHGNSSFEHGTKSAHMSGPEGTTTCQYEPEGAVAGKPQQPREITRVVESQVMVHRKIAPR